MAYDPELAPEKIMDGDTVTYIYKTRAANGRIYSQKHPYTKKQSRGRKKLDPEFVEARSQAITNFRKYISHMNAEEINTLCDEIFKSKN